MPDDIQELIKRYRGVMRSNARIRMLSTALVVALISAHVLWIFDRFRIFHEQGTAEMVSTLRQDFGLIDPAISDQAALMFSELIPVYMDAIDATFKEHRPMFVANTQRELEGLEAYAQKRFPEIEAALTALVVEQEAMTRRAITNVLSEAEAEAVVSQFSDAMLARLQELLRADLTVHREQANDIGARLESLSRARAETAPETMDSRELMGIMLELSGHNVRQTL